MHPNSTVESDARKNCARASLWTLYGMSERRYLPWLGVGLAIIIAFVGGVYAGVLLGVVEFQKLDSSAKGSVLTAELRALRAGNVDKVIEGKEIELDGSLVSALKFQESGMPWLFWPYMHSWDHTPSLRRIAQYRKEYPPVVPKHAPALGVDDPSDLRGFAREVSRSTDILIKRYGE
jgi:hypothetical protein